MAEPYHYIRFRWWTGVDLKEVSEDLRRFFSVETIDLPSNEHELSLLKDERNELKIRADTLIAIISCFRAILFQKDEAPFTARDLKLREKVLELYPHNRPTPLPWSFTHEPKFEIKR